jgi:hypothetical protein
MVLYLCFSVAENLSPYLISQFPNHVMGRIKRLRGARETLGQWVAHSCFKLKENYKYGLPEQFVYLNAGLLPGNQ